MFGHPWVLMFLVVPLAIGVWIWRRRGARLVLPIDHGRPGAGRLPHAFIRIGETLPVPVLVIAVLLLAGPQKLAAPKAKRSMTNIEFCLDISGSMTAGFGEGTRYDAAMNAVNSFLDYRKGDAFGLTFFSDAVLHWVPLTNDVSAFRCSPPFMHPKRQLPTGFGAGTQIGKALLACHDVLVSREEGDRMIVLVSDGASSDLDGGRDMEIARKLKKDNIVVHGVHIAENEVPGEVVNITTATGGEAFNPGDTNALEGVFKHIDEMQVTKIEKGAADQVDDFIPYCWTALILLAIYGLVQLGLRHTPW